MPVLVEPLHSQSLVRTVSFLGILTCGEEQTAAVRESFRPREKYLIMVKKHATQNRTREDIPTHTAYSFFWKITSICLFMQVYTVCLYKKIIFRNKNSYPDRESITTGFSIA